MNKPLSNYYRLETEKFRFNAKNQIAFPMMHSLNDQTHIVRTLKNAQSSIRALCNNHLDLAENNICYFTPAEKNKFLIIIRDPKYRFLSTINMVQKTVIQYGVKLQWSSFDLELNTDNHFAPQMFFIPLSARTKANIETKIPNIASRNVRWGNSVSADVLIDAIKNSQDEYVFFRMTTKNNPILDIAEYLNLDSDIITKAKNLRVNVSVPFIKYPRVPQFEKIMQKYYGQDIEFYNKVRCVND